MAGVFLPTRSTGALIPGRMIRSIHLWLVFGFSFGSIPALAASPALRPAVTAKIEAEYPALEKIYRDLHAHPELSFMEVKTAALVARELRALGCEVTEKVGNTGVVGVLRNGAGPTVLVRADMDGLPVKETSGVPYASTDIVKDLSGRDQPAMHACAHDAHVTGIIGTARALVALKADWAGTIVFVAQPAEEIGAGARAMLADGLYTRFPKPDYALALHVTSMLPAGLVGHGEGPFFADVRSVDILVRGVGGHGSAPQTTKDPVVLASQIVLALQTIVSRELAPGTPAVVTVGTIQGGTKRNIIPDEVKLELTLRSYEDAVAEKLIAAIRRICAGAAQAAGVPEARAPVVTVTSESTPATVNDPALTRRVVAQLSEWMGPAALKPWPAIMGGEDFSEFGRTVHRVPICIWWVGATDPARIEEAKRTGVPVPSNHSGTFAPVPEPTLKAAVTSMTAAVLGLVGKNRRTVQSLKWCVAQFWWDDSR
jgi:hippurate hydrolase